MSFIEDLYYGNLNPSSRAILPGSRRDELSRKISDGITAIEKELPDSTRELFNNWLDLNGELHVLDNADSFATGFRLGVSCFCDVFLPDSVSSKINR